MCCYFTALIGIKFAHSIIYDVRVFNFRNIVFLAGN